MLKYNKLVCDQPTKCNILAIFRAKQTLQLKSTIHLSSYNLKTYIAKINPKRYQTLFTKLIVILSSSWLLVTNASALSSKSAETEKMITGNPPYILLSDGITPLTDLRQIMGINFPNRNGQGGTEWISAWDTDQTLRAPKGMHFNDVWAYATPTDGVSYNPPALNVDDNDGDQVGGYVSGTIRATWFENDIQIPNDKLSWELWNCGGPYKLRVEVSNIQANTQYGLPRNRYYGSSSVEYRIIPNGQICYLRPNEMTHFGDHDPNVFNNTYGFSRNSGFPTTGFQNAAFTLVGSGSDQSLYRCYTSNGGGKISLSTIGGYASNCTVNYIAGQKSQFIQNGTPTITMEFYNGRYWEWIDNFTIPVPNKWPSKGSGKAMVFGDGYWFYDIKNYYALTFCSNIEKISYIQAHSLGFRAQYLYKADELSNNQSHFIRAVGTFMGEWGITKRYGGVWRPDGDLWTADLSSNLQNVYRVMGMTGRIETRSPRYQSTTTVCRGD